jgi:hypothetical protein
MPQHINVCKDRWNATKDERFVWVNKNSTICVIEKHSDSNWPFEEPSYDVPAKDSTGPGKLPGHVKQSLGNGTYTYDSKCCPDTLPKNVIVS